MAFLSSTASFTKAAALLAPEPEAKWEHADYDSQDISNRDVRSGCTVAVSLEAYRGWHK